MIGKAFGALGGIGKAFASGFNAVGDIASGNIGGLGALAKGSMRTALTMGGIGAAAGAAMTMNSADGPGKGAAVGAAVGAAALPVAGAALGGIYGAGKGMTYAAPIVAGGIGKAAVGLGKTLGAGAVNPVFKGSGMISRIGNSALNPVGRYAGAAKNLTTKLIDFEQGSAFAKDSVKKGFKMKPAGKALIGAGLLIGATRQAVQTSDSIRMGRMEGGVQRATPRMPSYANNAGASGDLAFALHANRRG